MQTRVRVAGLIKGPKDFAVQCYLHSSHSMQSSFPFSYSSSSYAFSRVCLRFVSYPKSMQNTPQTFALLGFAFLLRNDNKNKLSTTGKGHRYHSTHTRSTAKQCKSSTVWRSEHKKLALSLSHALMYGNENMNSCFLH